MGWVTDNVEGEMKGQVTFDDQMPIFDHFATAESVISFVKVDEDISSK
jgi:hypothetical protein